MLAAAVLVPFAALVFLGFWFAPTPIPSPPRGEGQGEGPTKPTLKVEAVRSSPPPSPPEERETTQVSEPIRAVQAEARRCFTDNQLTGKIRVRFTPNRDGGYEGVTVLSNTSQSPYLTACLEDVFAELRFVPAPGERYESTEHTFVFGTPAD